MYAACLASYNAGTPHGVWIDLEDKDEEDVREEIATMLAASKEPGAEEWVVHDYEGIPSSFGEYPDMGKIIEYVAGVSEHGDAWESYADNVGLQYATLEGFEASYSGEWDSPEAWAEEYMTSNMVEIPKFLENYIDFKKFARDCQLGGAITFVEKGGVFYAFNT
jgi:antirestriction protein